jgi:acyl-CoA thioester hydrolase
MLLTKSSRFKVQSSRFQECAFQNQCFTPPAAFLNFGQMASAPPTHAYRVPLHIAPSDIDELGHVNNVVYLRWVQEASAAHWSVLADEQVRKDNVWVVLRHEIDYAAPALPGDELHAFTWVGETEGVRSVRHVNIYNDKDKLLAAARTTWCLLDARSGRPKRVEGIVLSQLTDPRL